MGNHDTRHTGVAEGCEGTVLFFSSKGGQAHIWCVKGPSPLCLAFQSDFPDLWRHLNVGTVVSVSVQQVGLINRVTELAVQAVERF
ncbi:MAG: hypothetical protein AAFO72_01935 [Pseudomonadota bacterium]